MRRVLCGQPLYSLAVHLYIEFREVIAFSRAISAVHDLAQVEAVDAGGVFENYGGGCSLRVGGIADFRAFAVRCEPAYLYARRGSRASHLYFRGVFPIFRVEAHYASDLYRFRAELQFCPRIESDAIVYRYRFERHGGGAEAEPCPMRHIVGSRRSVRHHLYRIRREMDSRRPEAFVYALHAYDGNFSGKRPVNVLSGDFPPRHDPYVAGKLVYGHVVAVVVGNRDIQFARLHILPVEHEVVFALKWRMGCRNQRTVNERRPRAGGIGSDGRPLARKIEILRRGGEGGGA